MKKRLLTSLIVLLLLLQCLFLPAFADPTETEEEIETTEATAPTEESSDLLQITEPIGDKLPSPLLDYGTTTNFQIRAKAAALIDLNTGALAYSHHIDDKIYPASLTKIMTCMLALERGNLDDIVTVSYSSLQNLSLGGSSAGLLEGEKITLRDLLYCIMISSANEGCNVIGEYISGSIEDFVALMNQRAKEIGMASTHFMNTHGLHNDDHYTTVRDLSVLARWAWQYKAFRELASATSYVVPATNRSESRTLRTTNYLISGQTVGKYYYSKAVGLKTGFTTPAGGCLISTASDGDFNYLSIVCGCETLEHEDGTTTDERFTETVRLFEYGFNHYSYVQVLTDTSMVDMPEVQYAEGRPNVVVRAKDNVSVLLPDTCDLSKITLEVSYDSTAPLQAPLAKGEKVGTVTAKYNDHALASCDLVTLTAVERSAPTFVAEKTGGFFSGLWKFLKKIWFLTIPLLLALLAVAVLFIMRVINIRKAKKRRRSRANQARRDSHE